MTPRRFTFAQPNSLDADLQASRSKGGYAAGLNRTRQRRCFHCQKRLQHPYVRFCQKCDVDLCDSERCASIDSDLDGEQYTVTVECRKCPDTCHHCDTQEMSMTGCNRCGEPVCFHCGVDVYEDRLIVRVCLECPPQCGCGEVLVSEEFERCPSCQIDNAEQMAVLRP